MRVAAISSEKGDFVHWRLDSIEINQYEKYDGFADTQAVKVVPTSKARATSQPHTHRVRTSHDDCNHGRCFCMFPHEHGRIDSCTYTKRNCV